MVRNPTIVKNSELFVTQSMPSYAIAVQDACVCRQAGQNRRGSILFGPVKDIGQPDQYGSCCRSEWCGSVPVMMTPSNWLLQRSSMPK